MDSGLSAKQLKNRIAQAGLDQNRLKAIVVSHEHRDHVSGVGVLARMLKLPVYLNEGTYHRSSQFLDKVTPHFFTTGNPFALGPFRIHPFSISHDTIDPVGFTFQYQDLKMGLATDLGVATALVRDHLQECHALVVEANHDPDMLINGPYPWDLKQRVRGRLGHLSNCDTAELLTQLDHPGLQSVVLAHLSEMNNLPQKALETVGSAISRPRFSLTAADQNRPTRVFDIISNK